MRRDRALRVHRSRDRVPGTGKDDEERVALRVDLVSGVAFEGLPQKALMLGEDLAIALAELAFESRRAFDVREQKRDGAPRKLREP